MTDKILDRDSLFYNETTRDAYEAVRLEKDDFVYVECDKHDTPLRFKVFFGDSMYLKAQTCPQCMEEAKEAGRREMEREPWKRIVELAKAKIKEQP